MRYSSILVGLLLFPALVAADPHGAVRPVDHAARATLLRTTEQSPLVRDMIRQLNDTDVIVHFEMTRALPGGIGGTTRFVASRGGRRYLRLTLSSELPPRARMAMLGHELQHALEIARSSAGDVDALRRLLQENGYLHNSRYYETEAARRVERAVRYECAQRPSQ